MRSLDSIVERALALHAAGKVRGRNWTLAQVCEHLALAIELTARSDVAEDRRVSPLRGVRQWFARRTVLSLGFIPAGAESPRPAVPRPEVELDDALRQLRAAIAVFEQRMRDPHACWPSHFALGRLTGRHWHRFHLVHADHHFRRVT